MVDFPASYVSLQEGSNIEWQPRLIAPWPGLKVLDTPTGSGKSLVAVAALFKALGEGERRERGLLG